MKKIFGGLVVAVLVFIMILSGCTGGGGNVSNNSSSGSEGQSSNAGGGGGTQTGSEAAPADDEPLNISVMAATFGAVPTGTLVQEEWQSRMEAYIGRKLNIEWNYVPWGQEYLDKFKLVLASGDLPDIMTNIGNEVQRQYAGQGVLLDIAPYLDTVAVNYKRFYESTPNGDKSLRSPEGTMTLFGDGWINRDNNHGSGYGAIYRFDIFEKHNLKIPETLDEFYEAAAALKQLYPDVYPVNSVDWPPIREAFMGINHTGLSIYWNGSEYKYGPIEDAYKEALMFMNKLYREKLLDPEFMTQTFDQIKEKATTGRTFMIPISHWIRTVDFTIADAGMKWGAAMMPANPQYGTPWKPYSNEPGMIARPYHGVVVSAKTEYPELVVKMVDYQYSDEMIELLTWGIEGVTFEVVNGKKQWTKEVLEAPDPNKVLEKYGSMMSGSNRPGFVFSPQDFEPGIARDKPVLFYHEGKVYDDKIMINATREFGGPESVAPIEPAVLLSGDEELEKSRVLTTISTYVDEMTIKFINGDKSFDEWEDYKAQIKKLGDYEAILRLMNDKVK